MFSLHADPLNRSGWMADGRSGWLIGGGAPLRRGGPLVGGNQ